MRKRRGVLAAALAVSVLALGCGDDGGATAPFGSAGGGGDQAGEAAAGGTTDGDDTTSDPAVAPGGDGGQGDITPEAAGEVAMNTMRIGSVVWERTLPMTSGQCFLYEDDGTLPDSGTVWGTADGDEDIHFSANYRQDGTFGAQVDSDSYFWVAGSQNGTVDELTIELDFENLIVSGTGVFTNAFTGESADGSFRFQCDPDDQ